MAKMYQVSAPRKSGYLKTFDAEAQAQEHAAELTHCHVDDMIMVESPDGAITYCYGNQQDADADQDGAYAVQYYEVQV